ncbi:hypothetical protein NDU88_005333, partial [Pleurodeles waltl]
MRRTSGARPCCVDIGDPNDGVSNAKPSVVDVMCSQGTVLNPMSGEAVMRRFGGRVEAAVDERCEDLLRECITQW